MLTFEYHWLDHDLVANRTLLLAIQIRRGHCFSVEISWIHVQNIDFFHLRILLLNLKLHELFGSDIVCDNISI